MIDIKRTAAAALSLLAGLLALSAPAFGQWGGPASVFAVEAEERAFANRIEALGTLEPNERVDLTVNAADRITALYFDDGERVPAGKTLLSLAQREQVALVEAAEAELDEARRAFERVENLAAQDLVAQSSLDAARRDLDSARAQLRAVQSRQADRTLVAPFDGVLGFRNVSIGSYVRPGDVVATLIDDSVMKLDFAVPSVFLTALRPGLTITASSRDVPDAVFNGTVASIDNRIDPVTRSVRVRALIPNDAQVLKAGMFMTVTLDAEPRTGVAVPESALQPVGPKNFVFVIADEEAGLTARRREVTIGMREAGRVEVVAGVVAGERVITEGLIRVREGAQVIVRDPSMLTPGSAGSDDRATTGRGASASTFSATAAPG